MGNFLLAQSQLFIKVSGKCGSLFTEERLAVEVLFAHRAVVEDFPLSWHLNVVLRNGVKKPPSLCLLHYVIPMFRVCVQRIELLAKRQLL